MQAKIFSDDLNRVIAATKDFVLGQEQPNRTEFRYIKLIFDAKYSNMTAIALDGYRISVEHCVISDCDENFVAYIKPTLKLPKREYVTLTLYENAVEKEVEIRGKDYAFTFTQPRYETKFDYTKVIPQRDKQVFRIGFNANYLLDALRAAKISNGNSFRKPIIFEFYGEAAPAIIRTGKDDDIKVVLPVRISGD